MSLSKEYSEHYLTKNGWVQVYEKTDFHPRKQINEIPEEYYLVCKYIEEMPSGFSEMFRDVEVLYRKDDSEKIIETLIKEFGNCPRII